MMSTPAGSEVADATSTTTHIEELPLPGRSGESGGGEADTAGSTSVSTTSPEQTKTEHGTAAEAATQAADAAVTSTAESAVVATAATAIHPMPVLTDNADNTSALQSKTQSADVVDRTEAESQYSNSEQAGNVIAAANDTKLAQEQSLAADQQWMLSHAGSRYTVQLMAMDRAKVDSFITANKLDDNVRLFQTTNHLGEAVVAVVSGDYETRQAAQQAAARLDRRLGNIKSWVRSFASVQQSINQYQQRPAQNGQEQLIARHEQRLLRAPASRYTLQLMAMDDAATLAYLRKHDMLNKVLLFRPRGGDTGLLAAVTGEYSSKDEAEKAAHQLIQELPGIRPWPRSMASVQEVIRQEAPRR